MPDEIEKINFCFLGLAQGLRVTVCVPGDRGVTSSLHPECILGVSGAEEQACMVQAFCHLAVSSLGAAVEL